MSFRNLLIGLQVRTYSGISLSHNIMASPVDVAHVPKSITETTKEEYDASSVLWIDWDGPLDTLNPKKYVPP